jgi:hypothetical protein
VKCVWQKSYGAMVEGVVAKKISSVGFCFARRGRCWSEVFISLSRGKVRDDPLRNVFKEVECLSKSCF